MDDLGYGLDTHFDLKGNFKGLCLSPRLVNQFSEDAFPEEETVRKFMIMLLPEDIICDIVARVSRWDYPALSLVSKFFRSLVTSPDLYSRRSLLGCTEHCLYVVLQNSETNENQLYILRRETKGSRLVLIPSLPAIHDLRGFLAVGSKIYVFGGSNLCKSSSAFSIDCKFHTVQLLPDMPSPMACAKAGLIDEKIYVIGMDGKGVVMVVFDTETQMWEPNIIKPGIELIQLSVGCVVMADKVYTCDFRKSCVYEPKEKKWKSEEVLSANKLWWWSPCVVDDVLYYYGKSELRAYDPKQRCCKVVNSVDSSLLPARDLVYWSNTSNYGGKLAVLNETIGETRELWLAVIALTRRGEGTIWGELETIHRIDNVIGDNFKFRKILSVVV